MIASENSGCPMVQEMWREPPDRMANEHLFSAYSATRHELPRV